MASKKKKRRRKHLLSFYTRQAIAKTILALVILFGTMYVVYFLLDVGFDAYFAAHG